MSEKTQEDKIQLTPQEPSPLDIATYKYFSRWNKYLQGTKLIRDALAYKKMFDVNESWGADREMFEWFKEDASTLMEEIWSDMREFRKELIELRSNMIAERKKAKEKKNDGK